jgi:hypothetical protein
VSSSSSRNTTASSNQTIQETINNVDNRVAQGDGSVGGNVNLNLGSGASASGINVSTTDYGAVNAGLTLGLKSLDNAAEAARQNTQLSQDTVAKTIALAGNTANVASATALQSFIKWIGIALVVGLGGYALAKAAPALKG